MNAKQFRYVLVLAKEGSFSKAADVLNISQPSLSQYVKKIEQQLGVPLFNRTNGILRLTDAGRLYIETGRKVLDLEHQMETEINDLKAHKTGSIIIGTAPYRAAGMMPLIAYRFKQIHPRMHLVVREGTTAELIDGMEHGEYDICLTLRHPDNKSYIYETVMEEELVLAVPSKDAVFTTEVHENRKYPAINAELINNKALVQLTDRQFMQIQLNAFLKKYHLSVKTAAIVKSLEAQIEMVKAGVGMAIVPSGIDRFCAHDEVVFYSFVQELPKREVAVMWRREKKLSETAEELKNMILDIKW